MAAVLTGTPTVVTWAAGADPAGQSITVPADATAVYMFWSAFFDGGVSTCTLGGAAADQSFEVAGVETFPNNGTGVLAWYNRGTGSKTLDVAWDDAPVEGPVCIVAYVKNGDTTAWRDADAMSENSPTTTVTLTTVSGDLVIKFDQHYGAGPSNSSGWTSAQTGTNNGEGCRLAYISATGTTQACPSEDESYSSIVAISIPAGGASQSNAPRAMHHYRQRS